MGNSWRDSICRRAGCRRLACAAGECRFHLCQTLSVSFDEDDAGLIPEIDEPGATPRRMREVDSALRCDACFLRALWLVEIPRPRYGGIARPPEVARFRLCTEHAENVRHLDRRAALHEIRGAKT